LYEGDIFAGTHGRGMFRTTSLMTARTIGVKEESKPAFRNNKSTDLTLSPNPAKDYTMIQLELKASDVVNIFVRDISGRLVKQIKINSLEAGRQSLRVDTDDMANGTYIITAQYGDTLRSGRLTVAR
jgi:flagellar hook assembly protein FlgD